MSRTEELREKFWGVKVKPEPKYVADDGTCLLCRGTGRDPMSDTMNWLPCDYCHGQGKVQRAR